MASVALLTAGQVMDAAAALLNDNAKQIYTYPVQVPYLNMALIELREFLALNDVPTVDKKSVVITVPAGTTEIIYDSTPPVPELPDDFLEPITVWQKNVGTSGYTPVPFVATLSEAYDGVATAGIIEYTWANQKIQFPASTSAMSVKIDYIGQVILPVVDETSDIDILTAQSFLQYRTAGLVAEFVEENKARAGDLNGNASLAIDRVLGIGTKSGQGVVTRRRPFRSGYKSR